MERERPASQPTERVKEAARTVGHGAEGNGRLCPTFHSASCAPLGTRHSPGRSRPFTVSHSQPLDLSGPRGDPPMQVSTRC